MLRLSVGALRTRWQLFAGTVVAVALGVGLMQSGLQLMAATSRPVLPAGLSPYDRAGAALAGIAAGPYGPAALAVPWRLLGLTFGAALVVVGAAAAVTASRATPRRLGTC